MSSFDEEKNKPIEGFNIAYSDEELQIAKKLAEGAKRLNKAINDAMHDKLINSNKEQEKMKKYDIDLDKVATDLDDFLCDFDVYTTVNNHDWSVEVVDHKYDSHLLTLQWNNINNIDWELRWSVQVGGLNNCVKNGEFSQLMRIMNYVDEFIRDWYKDHPEPKPDKNRFLLELIESRIFMKYVDTKAKCKLNGSVLSLQVECLNHFEDSFRASYLIKDQSIYLFECQSRGKLVTKEKELSTIVCKCVMEWDKWEEWDE